MAFEYEIFDGTYVTSLTDLLVRATNEPTTKKMFTVHAYAAWKSYNL